jgi:hypothetical protein
MKAMRLVILISVSVIVVSGLGSPNARHTQNKPIPDGSEVKQQIVELERRWQRAVVNRDRQALESLLAKEFSEQEWIGNNIEQRDGGIRTIKRHRYIELVMESTFQTYAISKGISVDSKDAETAVASFVLTAELGGHLIPLSSSESGRADYQIVDTWVHNRDGWHVSLRQAKPATASMIVPLRK